MSKFVKTQSVVALLVISTFLIEVPSASAMNFQNLCFSFLGRISGIFQHRRVVPSKSTYSNEERRILEKMNLLDRTAERNAERVKESTDVWIKGNAFERVHSDYAIKMFIEDTAPEWTLKLPFVPSTQQLPIQQP